jgi:hypothetical protein
MRSITSDARFNRKEKVMTRESVLIIAFAVTVVTTLALASPAAAQEAEEYVEYVVWVDALNLRAEPSPEAEILKILKRGRRVGNLSEAVTEVEGRYWRRVEIEGETGWVPDQRVLPDYFYDPFRKADELARAGDAEGMIAAAIEGLKEVGHLEDKEDYCYRVSPDGEKVFVDLEYGEPPRWGLGYPDVRYVFQPVPVLYFVNSLGLAKYLFFDAHIPGEWSEDSRHYVCAEPYWIELIDTGEWGRKRLGARNYTEDAPDFEISGGYVIWLSWEEPKKRLPSPFDEGLSVPVLLAYNLDNGEVIRLLEADLSTLKDKSHSCDVGYDYYEIKMAPTGLYPPDLEDSELYKRLSGAYSLARLSQA